MDTEKTDLEMRLHKAKVTYDRYKEMVRAYPEQQERLYPILQGCKDLIWDLEKKLEATVRSA